MIKTLALIVFFSINAQFVEKEIKPDKTQNLENLLKNCGDFQADEYTVSPYLKAAVYLQKLGETEATDQLKTLAKTYKYEDQIITLCRMLFEPNKPSEFRRPLIGAAHFLGKTDYIDWKQEPIEIINSIPFLITRGYSLAGKAEQAISYLNYSIENGKWSIIKFSEASLVEKQTALNLLIKSSKWKAKLSKYEIEFLSKQIKE